MAKKINPKSVYDDFTANRLVAANTPNRKWKDLSEREKSFFLFLINNLCGVSAKPTENTPIGSLCAYLEDCINTTVQSESYRVELYDFLAFERE